MVSFSLTVYCDKVKRSFYGLAHPCHRIRLHLPKESPERKWLLPSSRLLKNYLCFILEGIKISPLLLLLLLLFLLFNEGILLNFRFCFFNAYFNYNKTHLNWFPYPEGFWSNFFSCDLFISLRRMMGLLHIFRAENYPHLLPSFFILKYSIYRQNDWLIALLNLLHKFWMNHCHFSIGYPNRIQKCIFIA